MTLIVIGSSILAGRYAAPFLSKELRQWRVEWRVRRSLRAAMGTALAA
jgi:hypothetical protein